MNTRLQGYRLSPQQRRIWQRQGASTAFSAELLIEITGPLDVSRLSRAMDQVILRHEILRTRFVARRGLKWPLQVVEEDLRLPILLVQALAGKSATAVDLSRGPLLDASLVQNARERHLLELRVPSLCADARALGVLFRELVAEYGAMPSPEQTLQYAQYADWQLGLLEEAEAREPSAGEKPLSPPPPVFPFEKRTATTSCDDIESIPVSVDPLCVDRLAARADTSADVVLLASWLSLLHRLSGEPSVQSHVCINGRIYDELKTALGPMDQYLPLTVSIDETTRFIDLVGTIRRAVEDTEERLTDARALGHTDSEQEPPAVGFDYLDLAPELRVNDTGFSVRKQHANLDRFKVRLSCARDQQSLRLALSYDKATFDPASMAALASSLCEILHHASEHPERSVATLNLLDPSERARILALSTGPVPSGRPASAAHHLFERQVALTPSVIAAEAGARQLTYAELNERADRVAARLVRDGVGREVFVAVAMDTSLALLVAMLGVLKAGGVYVPLDPRDPPRRLSRALGLALPRVILTRPEFRAHLPEDAGPLLLLDEEGALSDPLDGAAATRPAELHEDNLAYVIFTSGSSGEPKGVCVSHGALINYLAWCVRAYAPSNRSGAWVHSSPSFDLGLTALLAPLVAGGRAVFVPNAARPDALSEALPTRSDVGLLKLTPSHLRSLRYQLDAEATKRLPRVMVVGGESLYHEDIEHVFSGSAPIQVFNEYGPTEATVGCCVEEVTSSPGRAGPASIGRPIPGAKILILDEEMQPVPAGVKGALYIGGIGLARGYLGSPALTALRFVPDPFSEHPGQRLYRTGDRACVMPDGRFEFFGRDDDQVKIRGYRLELGEIEAALLRHPAVGECAAVVQGGNTPGGKHLIAFVTPRPGVAPASVPSSEELRAHLRPWLPEALIPASITALATLPRAPSGKLDRAALACTPATAAKVAPRDDIEEILAGVFRQVLGVERVGVDDSFFALGGDSIRSIQVVARARARSIALSVDQLFASPTIRALAERARTSRAEPAPPQTEPFALLKPEDRARLPEGVVDAYPLAALQAGMIFHRDLAVDSVVYHDIFSFHLDIPFDEARFHIAAKALVERHPAQRTTFDLTHFSEPLQLVHKRGPDPLTVEDLRGQSVEEQKRAISEYFARERARGLPISELPLIRFHVHHRSDETFQFNVSFHHAVIDGWSDATMLTELFHHYLSLLAGEDPALTPPRAYFRDFIALERQAIASRETAEFWERTLADSAPMRLPRRTEAHRAERERRIVRKVLELPGELSQGLRALALATAVPLKTVLLAAHLRVMSALGGDRDVLTCMVSSGRPEGIDGDRVLGLFINSIPVRARLEGGSFIDLVQQTLTIEQELLPHRRLPMAEIRRRKGGEALSEVLFYFTDYHVYRSRQSLGRVKVLDFRPQEETSFTLTVSFGVDPVGGAIRFELMADEESLGAETIDVIEGCFLRALSTMSQTPNARYESADVLPDEVRRRLLVEWNNTDRDFSAQEACLHEMFEAQVKRTPHAVALVSEGIEWTYAALEDKADRLASHLRSLGVSSEAIVGVYMGRCPELVVALLGVLKVGAAYLPLDPEHPRERLTFMLEEAAAPVVITLGLWMDNAPRRKGTTLIDLAAIPEGIRRGGVPHRAAADDPAYVIYTSGSTGMPKGVVNTHRGVQNRILWMQDAYRLKPTDRVLQKTPFSFDVSVWEFFWPLTVGAAMVVAPGDAHRDAGVLAKSIDQSGVTVMHFVPSMLDAFLEQLKKGSATSLRLVVCSGEELTGSLRDRFFAQIPGATLCNLYGPTEAAIDVTAWTCRHGDSGAVPIGRPIANMKTYVLDSFMEPVPVGVTGELYLGGVGLARGYLRRPALTAERFVADPFGRMPGARLYRTGDLARYLPDGNLEFCGRADHQIKVRGVRIELGEIEAALREHSGVRAALVQAFGERGSPLALSAYVVREDASLTSDELRQHLRRRLPEPMVPSYITFLPALPVTANGKVDRRALPDPRSGAREEAPEYIPPSTPMEELIASVWKNLLGVERVGQDDDFFLLGGHSLLLVRAAGLLRELLQVHLPIRMFYERPTLGELAKGIEDLRRAAGATQAEGGEA